MRPTYYVRALFSILGCKNIACLLLGELNLSRVHFHKCTDDGLLAFAVHGCHRENRTVPESRKTSRYWCEASLMFCKQTVRFAIAQFLFVGQETPHFIPYELLYFVCASCLWILFRDSSIGAASIRASWLTTATVHGGCRPRPVHAGFSPPEKFKVCPMWLRCAPLVCGCNRRHNKSYACRKFGGQPVKSSSRHFQPLHTRRRLLTRENF